MNMGQLSSLRPQLGHVHVRHLRHWPGLILGLSLQKQAIRYTTYLVLLTFHRNQMSAAVKCRKPRYLVSSFSNREKIRR